MKLSSNNSQNFTIVIPTIRQESITPFFNAWGDEFKSKNVIIVEDNPEKTFSLPSWVEHYSWKEIDNELGKDSWIISRRSSAVRSFGFLKAWSKKSKYVITLDDDCLPENRFKKGGFLKEIQKNLEKVWEDDSWVNTLDGLSVFPRGYPYNIRRKKLKTFLHHGLWSNIPDFDGKTQKKNPDFRTPEFTSVVKVPYGRFFPMCSMNLAFRREMIPALYFLLMGQNNKGDKWPYDRFEDIWSGIFMKKICDHLGFAVSSGAPSVLHSRASNVETNIKKEKPGIIDNEWLWKEVSNFSLKSETVKGCYEELGKQIMKRGSYWNKLGTAMIIWSELFK